MRWCDLCYRSWTFAYCGQHPHTRQPGPLRPTLTYVPCAAPATLDRVYRVLLTALPLAPSHRQALRQRGLADAEMLRRQYRTFPLAGRAALAKHLVAQLGVDLCAQVPGFYLAARDGQRWWSLAGAAGLLIPVRSLDGHIVALKVRADDPGDGPKYTTISSAKHGGPSPGAQVHGPLYSGQGDTVRLTEGELKSDIATVLSGLLTISIPGVALWRQGLPVLQALPPQRVLVAFDADWRTNLHVAQALGQVVAALVGAGYTVEVENWAPPLGKGIDDVLAAGHTPTVQSAVPWLHRARTFPEKSGGRPSHIVVEVR
jgi:DNA primase